MHGTRRASYMQNWEELELLVLAISTNHMHAPVICILHISNHQSHEIIMRETKFIVTPTHAWKIYRIAQNFGGGKLWRIDHFRVLARKTLANLQLYISHFSESGIWLGKILANDVPFTKFAKVFPRQNFALYGIYAMKHYINASGCFVNP